MSWRLWSSVPFLFLAPQAAWAQPYAFVSSAAGDSIAILDLASDTLRGSLPLAGLPSGLALSPDGSRLFVARSSADSLASIDTATGAVTFIAVGTSPSGVAVDPSGARVYVANTADDTLSVVDPAAGMVVATIPVPETPLALAAGTDRVYLAHWVTGQISVLDVPSQGLVATVSVGRFPAGLALAPDGSRLYVANFLDDTVSVIDTASLAVTATVPVGRRPRGLALDPGAGRLYVAGFDGGELSVIDTATNQVVLSGTSGGTNPMDLALGPGGERLYVAHLTTGKSITVLDAASLVPLSAIEAPAGPVAIASFGGQAPLAKPWFRRLMQRASAAFRDSSRTPSGLRLAHRRPGRGWEFGTLSDDYFHNPYWVVSVLGPGQQETTRQNANGGSCYSGWRKTVHTGPINYWVVTAHQFVGSDGVEGPDGVYDPAVRGAINSIDVSWDRWVTTQGGFEFSFDYAIVVQGGTIFQSAQLDALGFCDPMSWSGLQATDFVDSVNFVEHPDFSASGLPLSFGYMRWTNHPDDMQVETGTDNFLVTVNHGNGPGLLSLHPSLIMIAVQPGGSSEEVTVVVYRHDGSLGAVDVTAEVRHSNGTTTTHMLHWDDGQEGPKSFVVDVAHTDSSIANVTLKDPTGGASIDHGGALIALVSLLDQLVTLVEDLLAAFSPLWLLALAGPAVLLAARRRGQRRPARSAPRSPS